MITFDPDFCMGEMFVISEDIYRRNAMQGEVYNIYG